MDFDEIYKEIPEEKFRHNMILSLQNGLWTYEFDIKEAPEIMKKSFCDIFEVEETFMWFFPHSSVDGQKYKCKPNFIDVDTEDVYGHIISFLNGLNNAMHGQRKYILDIGNYLTNSALKECDS